MAARVARVAAASRARAKEESSLAAADGESPRASADKVQECEGVEARGLEAVLVRLHNRQREALQARVMDVEGHGQAHRAEERERRRPREHPQRERDRAHELGRSCCVCPQQRLGQEGQVLGDHELGEALRVLQLVEAVVEHEHGDTHPQEEHAQLGRHV
eukprot:CAMPEP_0119161082 /NCGR_PEP_ID=MMETSP1315-20130426/982_1 /TAXON_ID=676789 /ORGANISM="Prasinoderma singularis, Strain RCC927" /LENGTH=159 /DNA_ID=CAMNT_0007153777 /DNA_START=56 /DNA_END=532 /DNA_ORIENTATION=-